MTDKEAVLEAVQGLPDDSSLAEIAEERQIMAAIRRERANVATGRTKTHERAKRLLESWTSRWTIE
ncbi:MAG TPA: hypothetical protein VJX67_17745 [Blastocatellia bacterium]|nr:hypothetical protein [Blastocatellia bacterium]